MAYGINDLLGLSNVPLHFLQGCYAIQMRMEPIGCWPGDGCERGNREGSGHQLFAAAFGAIKCSHEFIDLCITVLAVEGQGFSQRATLAAAHPSWSLGFDSCLCCFCCGQALIGVLSRECCIEDAGERVDIISRMGWLVIKQFLAGIGR